MRCQLLKNSVVPLFFLIVEVSSFMNIELFVIPSDNSQDPLLVETVEWLFEVQPRKKVVLEKLDFMDEVTFTGIMPMKHLSALDVPRTLPLSFEWKNEDILWTDIHTSIRYRAVCYRNFYGPRCEDFCRSNSRYSCDSNGKRVCLDGWAGDKCDRAVPRCQSCLNGASCSGRAFVDLKCICVPGFEGKHCENRVRSTALPSTVATTVETTTIESETLVWVVEKDDSKVFFLLVLTLSSLLLTFIILSAVFLYRKCLRMSTVQNARNPGEEELNTVSSKVCVPDCPKKLPHSFSDQYTGRYSAEPRRLSISSCPAEYEEISHLPRPRSPKPFIYLSHEALHV